VVAIKRVKCIELDEDKTLKVGEIYEVMYTYMRRDFLIVNSKGFEQFYNKELFEEMEGEN
jgi:hypothetical protein